MNKVILMGRLTRDPEVRYSQGERQMAIARYTLAVDRRGRRDAGQDAQADFINCVAWRQTAEFIANYFRKGQRIGLNGSIQTRQYQDKDTGKNRTAFEVVINNTYFVESKKAEEPQNNPYLPPVQTSKAQLEDFSDIRDDDGDLPF